MPDLHRKSLKVVEEPSCGTDLAEPSAERAGVRGKTPVRGFPLRPKLRAAVPQRLPSTTFPDFSCKTRGSLLRVGPLLRPAPSCHGSCCPWAAAGALQRAAVLERRSGHRGEGRRLWAVTGPLWCCNLRVVIRVGAINALTEKNLSLSSSNRKILFC